MSAGLNPGTREGQPLKLWELPLQKHPFRKSSTLLFGEAGSGQGRPADLTVNIQELLFWPESPSRSAAVFSQGVVSGRPSSQFGLPGHADYSAGWCLGLNISFLGKMLGHEDSGMTLPGGTGVP